MATRNKNNNGNKIEIKKRIGGKRVSEVELEIKLPIGRGKRTASTIKKKTVRRIVKRTRKK